MKKGISYYKDFLIIAGFAISFGTILIGWSNARTKRALTDDQVRRNTEAIDKAQLEVVVFRLDGIDEKIDLILELVK